VEYIILEEMEKHRSALCKVSKISNEENVATSSIDVKTPQITPTIMIPPGLEHLSIAATKNFMIPFAPFN
jgi:hypothetical protein